MSNDYQPPAVRESAFNCPFCGVYAHQAWSGSVSFTYGGASYTFSSVDISICQRCKARAIWVNEELLYPEATAAPLPNPDMPDDVKGDYLEAASILTKSPRGAVALLRLAIQKLCVALGQKGENLNDDIAALVKAGLPAKIQQALDIVRVVGNNAVHPGVIDLKDKPETARALFGLINLIIQNRITEPKETAALFDTLPHGVKEQIAKRDTPKS